MYFRNEFYFLSNMYPCSVKFKGLEFNCSESLFQACKCESPYDVKQFTVLNGYNAKALGRTVKLRSDWNDIRLSVMYCAVKLKFEQNEYLRIKLKSIEGDIVEDNNHNDRFWGVCNGIGENHLGKILMKIREEL